MNIDRLLRDVESSLPMFEEPQRHELMGVLREAIARERRRLDPGLTVEAIGRPLRMDEALAEALRQLERLLEIDAALFASCEPGLGFRAVAAEGDELSGLVGTRLEDPRLQAIVDSRQAAVVADSDAEGRPLPLPGPPALRTWAALPLLHEGEVSGLVVFGRRLPSGFEEDELLRAKRVAFAAAAVLSRGRQLAQVQRYADLLEQVVDLDLRVFRGASPQSLAQAILDGACRVGCYRGGMLVLQTPQGPRVAAACGESFAEAVGRAAPPDLAATAPRRIDATRMLEVAESLGILLPAGQAFLVPLASPEGYVGGLALLDPDGESPDDRLVEAYATRAALAWRHAQSLLTRS